MAESDSDNSSWENFSIDSEGNFTESSSSSDDSDSDYVQSNDDEIVVRGAQPYRFEPLQERGANDGEADGQDGTQADDDRRVRLQNTDWCSCGNCTIMESVENCLCCKEAPAIQQKIEHTGVDPDTLSCFKDHPWYEATCLNPGTLETAYYQYRQQYGARAVEGDRASKYRHVSYRQVVRWCWGFLGRQNRVPLPSCIMNKTRAAYPAPDGNYKGFKYPDLDE
ncbi:P2X purinoceptor 7-like [Patiria miniata]|uniref:P2X purinoreceptor 7 intracellular domain-containing protein n=1 Tax=Patiria miniata TaxID=46514 RepID=A0A914AFU1_PATMI|nr:P2X purinoceptor 7-like [Patiria miniata]